MFKTFLLEALGEDPFPVFSWFWGCKHSWVHSFSFILKAAEWPFCPLGPLLLSSIVSLYLTLCLPPTRTCEITLGPPTSSWKPHRFMILPLITSLKSLLPYSKVTFTGFGIKMWTSLGGIIQSTAGPLKSHVMILGGNSSRREGKREGKRKRKSGPLQLDFISLIYFFNCIL